MIFYYMETLSTSEDIYAIPIRPESRYIHWTDGYAINLSSLKRQISKGTKCVIEGQVPDVEESPF